MATRDAFAEWQALGQQYWQGLNDFGQQFLKGSAPAPAKTPWQEGIDQWSKLFQASAGSSRMGSDAQGVLDQLMQQGKSYLSTLEELFKAGAGGQQADLATLARQSLEQFRQTQPWLNGLGDFGKWFDGNAVSALLAQFGADPEQLARIPAFGSGREQQERLSRLAADFSVFQRELNRYNALIARSMESAIRRMEDKLGERSEPGRQLTSLKPVYDLWIDALEESYAEVALSPEFREVYGALVNAQMRVKSGVQQQVERSTGELGMPTRTELDGVHRKLAEVRRSVRSLDGAQVEALREEVAALKRELAQLRAAVASPVAAAAPQAGIASEPAPSPAAAKAPAARKSASKSAAPRAPRK